ncbi:hypothetical protein B0H15DRAFT_934137 [Mycena belliarum]|uniref:Infection structure specific protein n=1 Tax=Mycena belliarum TaxID=1033014 RepID=A0AAD6XKQ7_9AGAR|nr:hypothetical protein B0H15DRAFT_934137 [Mycena belliae]
MVGIQTLCTVFFLVAPLSLVRGAAHGSPKATPFARRQVTVTASFTVDPLPTVTGAEVTSAYSAYKQACGADLNKVAVADLADWAAQGGSGDVDVTSDDYVQFLEGEPGDDWSQAEDACGDAQTSLSDVVLAAATNTDVSSSATATSSSARSSSTGRTGTATKTGTGTGTATGKGTGTQASASPSKTPDAASAHGPSVLGVGAALFLVLW